MKTVVPYQNFYADYENEVIFSQSQSVLILGSKADKKFTEYGFTIFIFILGPLEHVLTLYDRAEIWHS